MEKTKLDEKYNILEEKFPYENPFVDVVESIIKAKLENKITDQEASFLLNLVVKKELKKEMGSSVQFGNSDKISEIKTMFMNLKTKQVKHV